jgi:hypothetical protein
VVEVPRDQSIHPGNDIEGTMTSTTFQLLIIGAIGAGLYLIVWPILEFVK